MASRSGYILVLAQIYSMAIKLKPIFKTSIAVLALLLVIVIIVAYWLLNSQSGLTWMLTKASPMITVNSVSGNALNAQINGLRVDIDAVNITAETAKLDWSLSSLLKKSLTINSLNLSQLNVTLKEQAEQATTAYQPWQGLDLPIDIDLRQASVSDISIIQNDRQLLSLSQIDLQVNIKNNLLRINQLDINDADNFVTLEGSVDLSAAANGKVDLQHSTSWAAPSYQITTQGSIYGVWEELTIAQTATSPFAIELDATLNDGLSELLSWTAQLTSSQLPDQALMGEIISVGDGAFESRGQFAPGEGLDSLQASLSGGLSGENEQFANWQIEASTDYQQGNLQIDNLRLTQLNTQRPKYFEVSGQVDNVLAFTDPNNGEGRVDVIGQWNQLQWPIITDSPEVIADGQFKITGTSNDYQLMANTDGQLQGRPLQANIDAELAGEIIIINQIDLFAGNSKAIIDGKIDSAYDINWQLNSPDIGDLLPNASGNLISSGHLTGLRDKPKISLQAESQGLNAFTYSIESLELIADASVGDWQDQLNIVFNTGKISNATNAFAQSINLELTGTGLQHDLSIDAILGSDQLVSQNNNTEIKVQANGGVDGQRWSGQLSELTIDNPLTKTWSLNKSVTLSLAQGAIDVPETCLVNNDQSLCVTVTQDNQNLAANGTIHALNFANLDQFTQAYGLTSVGIANGEFSYVNAARDETSKINVRLESTSSSLSWPRPDSDPQEQETLSIEAIGFVFQQNDEFDLTASLKLQDGDSLNAKINIADGFESPQFNTAQLTGHVDATFQDLANLPPSLLNDITLDGGFSSKLTLGGSVSDPSINLFAEVNNGAVSLAELGLEIEQINLTASSEDSSVIILDGSLICGEGKLDIDGTFDLSNFSTPVIAVQLNGENIQLANTSELIVVGDVNFDTKVTSELIDLKGDIVIASAELDFQLPDSATLASNDVVLAGQEDTKSANQKLDISIDLGEKTHINAKGLNANLTGKLRIFQTLKGIVQGEGEINVENGKYAAYGEELEIDRGSLIFNKGSIDDPNLVLRAQKTIDTTVAGVSVTGRASSPVLNLYSTPSMSDQDILSVLIFNKPIGDIESSDGLTLLRIANSLRGNGEQSKLSKTTNSIRDTIGLSDLSFQLDGNAPSVEAGKRLSSKFFVGYGYGLLDAAQSIILKYQLNTAWSIKADVGVESGADLKYQLER